jgi:hypothetical protein
MQKFGRHGFTYSPVRKDPSQLLAFTRLTIVNSFSFDKNKCLIETTRYKVTFYTPKESTTQPDQTQSFFLSFCQWSYSSFSFLLFLNRKRAKHAP